MSQSPKTKFTCDGVYHYSPTPEHCGHKEGVICTAQPPAVDDTLEAAKTFFSKNPELFDVVESPNGQTESEFEHYVRIASAFADERTRLLRERLEKMERDRMIELAIAQFTGWREAESCMDIIMLVTSMGLTRKEWLKVRPQVQWLPQKYRNEINEYFKLSEEFPVEGK
jgi:hypothetical protein